MTENVSATSFSLGSRQFSSPDAEGVGCADFSPGRFQDAPSHNGRKISENLLTPSLKSPKRCHGTGLGNQQKLNRSSLLSRSANANRHERCAGRPGGLSGRQDKIGRASLRATPSSAPFASAERCRRNRRSPVSQN